MRKQDEFSNKVQQLLVILDDGRVEDCNERYRVEAITWLMVYGRLGRSTRNELIERRHKLDEIVYALNSVQRKNYGLISSFLAEIAVIKWLLE